MTPENSISSPNPRIITTAPGVINMDDHPKWMHKNTWKKLRHVHTGEEGIPFPSDDDISQTCDGDLDCDEDDDIITGLVKVNPKSHIESSNKIINADTNDGLEYGEDVAGINWDFSNTFVKKTIMSDYGPTQLKAEYKSGFFSTPLMSLLKFIPVAYINIFLKWVPPYAANDHRRETN